MVEGTDASFPAPDACDCEVTKIVSVLSEGCRVDTDASTNNVGSAPGADKEPEGDSDERDTTTDINTRGSPVTICSAALGTASCGCGYTTNPGSTVGDVVHLGGGAHRVIKVVAKVSLDGSCTDPADIFPCAINTKFGSAEINPLAACPCGDKEKVDNAHKGTALSIGKDTVEAVRPVVLVFDHT